MKVISEKWLGLMAMIVANLVLLIFGARQAWAVKPSDKKFDPKDTQRTAEYWRLNEKQNLKPVSAAMAKPPRVTPTPTPLPQPTNNYIVQPVIFVASDMALDAGNETAVNETIQWLRRWYSGAVEQNQTGYTFQVRGAIVYRAQQPLGYYKCANHEPACGNYDGIWANVQTELMEMGYALWTPGNSYVVLVKGAAGFAGANCNSGCGTNWPSPGPASTGGVAMLGDWALDAISGNVNNDCMAAIGTACYLEPQRGAIGHELGHTFGLAHAQDKTGSIMYSWWDYPNTSLFNDPGNNEKDLLRSQSQFFQTVACQYNDQVDQQNIPTLVKTRTKFQVSFETTNYSFCHWNAGSVGLGIVRDNVWGVSLLTLAQDVYPAQHTLLTGTLTAPLYKNSTPRMYESWWRMKVENTFFGPEMGGMITVMR